MKFIKIFILAMTIFPGMNIVATGQNIRNRGEDNDKSKVNVYYFHTNTRCVTCRTVEAEAKKDVEELFGNKVGFLVYNLDDAAGKVKAKELGVKSQILLIVKGNQKINITNEGFLYARSNPAKFYQVIEEKIKPLL